MRLLELHQRLKVSFPVYALFTKADLVAGFSEYFSYLNEAGRRQVWGATFQTADKSKNLIGDIPNEFDQLLERLSEETLDRLQDEPTPQHRVQLFGFAAQMARLKPQIHDFLNQIFEPTRYHVNASLRGFYFTSGTQQGTPIDQLIGSLARTFGAEEVSAARLSRRRQELLSHRSDHEGHHRRSRLGLDRPRRGAARIDHQDRGAGADRPCRGRTGRRLAHQLQEELGPDRADRAGRQ